ncbi:hypothetical protein SAMN02745216_03711 [Desulfatibacillum alkenivorans DSM 16219]|jgi:hypothetical protein|uniref:Uncharacterized protein n=2 Tax=Desulfatibacillum alkenivorans TaxID=259354 RepID=A0A1M6TKS7_9BACT|nr:hypothetical protein SAMN02745216_03711 [Desulfatibacillum alkenivorans DSM 16219]
MPATCFSRTQGRPSNDPLTALGCAILQQIHDLTDQETVHALDLSGESDTEKYLCERTLRNTRKRMIDNNLDEAAFTLVTQALAGAFDVDVRKHWLDSVHIHDSHALIPAIESVQEKGLGLESVTADTHYASDENVQKAAELGVELTV